MRCVLTALALLGSLAACTPDPATKPSLTREELMDPKSCATCHPTHYAEWSGSMHAYAAVDPLFLAMNRRGQRETKGALGNFCVKCHAPMAVELGATTDGLNLDAVPEKLKGVTCFFCHSVDAVQGTHDKPLHLATDGSLRAGIRSPHENTAHLAGYSQLHDRDQLSSSAMCGSCHDVVTPHGVFLERSFDEWKNSVFANAPGGATCGQCHMPQSSEEKPASSVEGSPNRRLHAHHFAAVDTALTDFPHKEIQQKLVQDALDSAVQSGVCVQQLGTSTRVQVVLDNVAAGHGFPSGAAQDRRLWVELVATKGTDVVYDSGVAPEGKSVTTLDDPDLWLLRDCLLDGQGGEVHMFWDAFSHEDGSLPALATFNIADPRYYQTHRQRTYPGPGRAMKDEPDTVRVRLHLVPVGLDVLDDLVASGDLDPKTRDLMSEHLLGSPSELVWTANGANNQTVVDRTTGDVWSCTTNTNINLRADRVEVPRGSCGR